MPPVATAIAIAAGVTALAALSWLAAVVRTAPTGDRFACLEQPSKLPHPRLSLLGLGALWLIGAGLCIPGEAARFVGTLLLLTVVILGVLAALAVRRQRARATVRVEIDGETAKLTDGTTEKCVPLEPGAVLAWTVGNGLSGPLYLQLAVGNGDDGFAIFVAPAARQWSLAEGASWLAAYSGWCPVERGPELLDRLAPFTVPGDQEWKPT